MSEQQFTNPSEKQATEIPTVGKYVEGLLTDEAINELPESEQGKVIIDRFIGAVVRNGEVSGSVDSYTPDVTLAIIADYFNGKEPNLRGVTSTDGLRDAAKLLEADSRTNHLMNRLEEQIILERNPRSGALEITLTTEAQLDGYIDGAGGKNDNPRAAQYDDPQKWIGAFMADVHDVASGRHEWRTTQTLAADIKDSGAVTPSYYKQAKELYEARNTAHFAGVDLELVRRSAEHMRGRDELTKKELGERSLFLATGGALDRYKQDDEEWFRRHTGSR